MMTRDRKGLAGIIDSLVFVCIICVIALLILDSPNGDTQSKRWDQSSMIHSVLIHSTISMMEMDDAGTNYSEAPVSQLLCEALGSGDRRLIDRLSGILGPIADPLIEPPYHYQWVVNGTNGEIRMGEGVIPSSCDIMASKVGVMHDGEVLTSVLYLWIL